MFHNLPPVTKVLLIINGAVFLAQLLLGSPLFAPFMLWPLGGASAGGLGFMPWQLLTAGGLFTMIVPIVVFLALQRYFVRGLTAGSVKG